MDKRILMLMFLILTFTIYIQPAIAICKTYSVCQSQCGYGNWAGYRSCPDSYEAGSYCYHSAACCGCLESSACEPCDGWGWCTYGGKDSPKPNVGECCEVMCTSGGWTQTPKASICPGDENPKTIDWCNEICECKYTRVCWDDNDCPTCQVCEYPGTKQAVCVNAVPGTDPKTPKDCSGCQRCLSGSCQDWDSACDGTDESCFCSSGSCVACTAPNICDSYACIEPDCIPDCTGRECGPDPVCGRSCGTCDETASSCYCSGGSCVACGPEETCSDVATCVPITSDTCSDGTLYGECSSTKPKYCEDGTLINKCSVCGCPAAKPKCRADGSCGTGDGGCSARCLDYDSGIDYLNPGFAKYRSGGDCDYSYSYDMCLSDVLLRESYCDGVSKRLKAPNCEDQYGSGSYCTRAACPSPKSDKLCAYCAIPVCLRDGQWDDKHEYKCDSDKTKLRCKADGSGYDDTNKCEHDHCGAYLHCNGLQPGYQYQSCGALKSYYWDRCSSNCGVEDYPTTCKAPPDTTSTIRSELRIIERLQKQVNLWD